MNNEPVAIVNTNCENNIQWYDDNPKKHNGYFLYTHPVNPYQSITNKKIEPTVVSYTHPVKKLTDDEIKQIWLEFDARDTHDWFIAIARAILRKASEK